MEIETQNVTEVTLLDDSYLHEEGRTEVFQKWLDSLETRHVKRAKAQVDGARKYIEMRRSRL